MADLLGRNGFRVERDHDLLTLAEDLAMQVHVRRSVLTGRIAIADR